MQCKAFNILLEDSDLIAKDVANWKELDTPSDFLPDIALYPRGGDAERAYTRSMKEEESDADPRRLPYMARTAWAWITLPVEVKVQKAGYDFNLNHPDAIRIRTKDADKARVQFAQYVAEIFLRQHRTHVFSLYIYRKYARIFRWDRSGILVTEPIDFVQNPRQLLNFVYRFAHLSPAQKGYDTSAKLATEDELKILKGFMDSRSPDPKIRGSKDMPQDKQQAQVEQEEHKVVEAIWAKRLVYPIYKVRITPLRHQPPSLTM